MLILTSTSPMLPEATASCRLRDMRKTEDSVNARGRRKALLLPAVRLEHLRYSGLRSELSNEEQLVHQLTLYN